MPSSKQRIEVWRGQRKRTSGGLTKDMLTKNKRGKIVSKKKSNQASDQNNLGGFLRKKGLKVPKDEMLYKKGEKSKKKSEQSKPAPKKSEQKKSAAAPKPKKKAVPKLQPPKKPQPKPVQKPQKKKTAAKKKPNPKINPVTKQPYAKKSAGGFVANAKVHIDNIVRGKRHQKPKAVKPMSAEESAAQINWADY